MKKKVFRERYAEVKVPEVIQGETITFVEEVKPKKRGRKKSVKSDK